MLHPETFDYIIIGSGFGGSVAALRLAEKGYSVAVLEQGQRFSPAGFPKSDWNLRKIPILAPSIGWHGDFRDVIFSKKLLFSPATGVGGGSPEKYANALQEEAQSR